MAADLLEQLQTTLGSAYTIERELGGGGMSRVFVATETALGRRVVVKVLPPELSSEVSADRFRREIQFAALLQHPHIVPLLTAGVAGDARDGAGGRLLYYTMPFVEGESLRQRLTREAPLPAATALRLLREIADALAYAHGRSVVHRDVKPENVLLLDGHALLADFGIARALERATLGQRLGPTATGMSVGTPGYMAPEQVGGESSVDARADVYALGAVGYEMLAGRPPFAGPNVRAVLAAQFGAAPAPLTEVRPELPPAVSGLISRALSTDREARPATAGAFRDALDEAMAGLGATSARPRAPAAPAAAPPSEHPEALALFEAARRSWSRRAPDELAPAASQLESAVALDPTFGLAHATLAAVRLARADVDLAPHDACAMAGAAAATAIELDPSLGEAHAALAYTRMLSWQWDGVAPGFRRAVEASPRSAVVRQWLATYLCAAGRLDEALREIACAQQLAADSAVVHTAAAALSYYARVWDRAVQDCRRAIALDPTASTVHVILGLAHAGRGTTEEAMAEFERAVDLAATVTPFTLGAVGCTLAGAGRRSDAQAALDQLATLGQRAQVSPFYSAAVWAALGERERAFAALAQAREARDGWLLALKVHPWMDPLRGDARFGELAGQVGP